MSWQARVMLVNGELVPFADARVHPLSLAVAYATAVFEGIRAYRNPHTGAHAFFRLDDHLRRLQRGMRVLRFERVYEMDWLRAQLCRLVLANEPDDDVYVRLLCYIEGIGPMASTGPVGMAAAAMPRERSKQADTGLSLGVSSWARLGDNASPPRVKATANYHNGRLAMLQARADGYDGALMLTAAGKVSEAPIAAFFMVRDGQLISPSRTSGILESITRDTVVELYRELHGRPVEEREVDRSELYFADEAFVCGTGQEIQPVVAIDRMPVGDGTVGPVTIRLRERYFDVVRGLVGDRAAWRTPVA